MAGQPHNKTGDYCRVCGKIFTKDSMTLSIRQREGDFIIRKLVCGKCYNEHYERGE